jgi:hypothetical protein
MFSEEEKEIDLFDCIETLPKEVIDIVDYYGQFNNLDYNQCKEFESKLNKLGFTFDYGLDACPYDLRAI